MTDFVFTGSNGLGGFNMLAWGAGDIINIVGENFPSSHSATLVTYGAAGVEFLTANGSFGAFDSHGNPTSGTITSASYLTDRFDASAGGPMTVSISGFSLSVPTFNNWVLTDNTPALHAFLFNGADSLTGSTGDDLLMGYGGGDTIDGGAGNDQIYGENFPGQEFLTSVAGNDSLSGGDGDDSLFGQGGNDTLNGDNGNDSLDGGDGDDTLNGGAGNDTLNGGAGHNALNGGDGDDIITSTQGADTIDGGDGVDTLVLQRASSALNFTLDAAAFVSSTGATLADGTVVRNIETSIVTTGSGADTLTITAASSGSFDLGAGTDNVTIDLSGASAGVSTGPNPDGPNGFLITIDSSHGIGILNAENVTITGTAFADRLGGGASNDLLIGGAGNDTLFAGAGNDTLLAGSGDDTLTYVAGGVATVDGGDGYDTLNLNLSSMSAAVTVSDADLGTPAGLTLPNGSTFKNIEHLAQVTLGSGDDTLSISSMPQSLDGGAGFDHLILDMSLLTTPLFFGPSGFNSVSIQGFETFTVTGGSGNDNIAGAAAADALSGGDGSDTLVGNAGADMLDGGNGNDILRGGAGVDVLTGGAGDDTLDGGDASNGISGESGDVIDGGDGIDTLVYVPSSFNIPINLSLDAAACASATGGTFAGMTVRNVEVFNITLGNLDDTFTLLTPPTQGTGTISAFGGNDTFIFDGSAVTSSVFLQTAGFDFNFGIGFATRFVLSGFDQFSVTGGSADDLLTGGAGSDTLSGGAGNDHLDGGGGADILIGGLGNDTYTVDNAGDVVSENAGEGTDTVNAFANYTLSANVENLSLFGPFGLNGTGNDLANVINGSANNNILNGGAGADTMAGGLGDDTYVVDNVGDLVTENANEGVDTVLASISYTLAANVENLTLTGSDTINATGNALGNILTGNTAANILDGGLGADTLIGGQGDDTFVVDNAGDVVTENANEGLDTVLASISFALAANVENLTLTGSAVINAAGNELGNVVTGNSAANILDGGLGADTMIGGQGDDTYIVDNYGDVVTENPGEGTDTVSASVTYTLTAYVENLTLTGAAALIGTGNELNNTIIGNDAGDVLYAKLGDDVINAGSGADTLWGGDGNDTLNGGAGADFLDGGNGNDNLSGGDGNDTLYGRAGNDVLDGGAGADTMYGGAGDDTYIVDNAGDLTIENSASGIDTVMASVTYGLNAFIENLTLTGTDTINGTGNILANTLTGNDSANVLSGLAGFDTLYGMGGDDTLNGGNGNDTLYGGAGNDILDGGNDVDTLNGGDGNDTLYGRTGADTLNGDAGNDTLYGGDGDDILNGGDDNDLLDGGNHNDALNGGNGDDTLYGRQNDDILHGDAGSDTLYGGDGVDTLNGGAGVDVLNGGNGNDTFVFAAGEANGDIVQDFNGLGAAAGDAIVFSGYGLAADGATFIQLDATHWQINSADGTIHETIVLANGASVDASDYVFGP